MVTKWVLFFLLLISAELWAGSDGVCTQESEVQFALSNRIRVNSVTPVKKLSPQFFGFNLDWLEFQWSLWDERADSVDSQVLDYLKPFKGAIYRYPGGTIANQMKWHDVVGDKSERPIKKFVDWMKPSRAQFGLDEYFRFIDDVEGKAWYVANLYGGQKQEQAPSLLAKESGDLSRYISSHYPNHSIYRWELGNELDRGAYLWSPHKLTSISKLHVDKIKAHDVDARFVSTMQEYSAQAKQGLKAADFNRKVASQMRGVTNEYAMHVYYDGKPGGQPIPNRITAICDAVMVAKKVQPNTQLSIWLTEHARVPPNAWVDPEWKKYWPQTADLQAAIGVSDLMIAASQIPSLKGAFIHSLHGTRGPWPLFHKNEVTKAYYPSTVYWALRILRESMQENVLATLSYSRNKSDYDGGYDIRASVLSNPARNQYALWAVNRSGDNTKINIQFARLAKQKLISKHVFLTHKNQKANNYQESIVKPETVKVHLLFDDRGNAVITLPPYSINAVSITTNMSD